MESRPFKKEGVKGNRPLYLVAGVAILLAGVAVVGGYAIYDQSDAGRVGTTTTTGATSHVELGVDPRKYGGINADAHVRLATARCERDQRCQGIGAGKRYLDREACASERRVQSDAWLPEARCRNGITPERVESCVAAIQSTSCETALETLDGIEACRAQSLCDKP
jgi:hypothetical protein